MRAGAAVFLFFRVGASGASGTSGASWFSPSRGHTGGHEAETGRSRRIHLTS